MPVLLFAVNLTVFIWFVCMSLCVFSMKTLKYLSLRPYSWPLLFSSRISAVSPMNSRRYCWPNSAPSLCNISERLFITFVSICSGKLAAGVPLRGEKLKMCIFANPTSLAKLTVCSKSLSVSPGKPTIISVVKAGLSSCDFIRAIVSLNSSALYCRHIFLRILFEPDWSDKCRCGMMLRCLRKVSSNRGVISAGSSELNLMRERPGICAIESRRSAKWSFR